MVKRSSGPISRGPGWDRSGVKVGVIQMGRGNGNDQMGQGRSVWRDDKVILILSGRHGVTDRGAG